MNPVFASDLLLDLLRRADGCRHEICGILRGIGPEVVRADPAANVAPDPARHFEIDPGALLAAWRDARRPDAPGIAGWYHSHPSGDPDPSPTDAARADPDGRLWLIMGGGVARVWRAVPAGLRHGRFDPVRFQVRANRVDIWCEAVQMDHTGTLTSIGQREVRR